MRGVGANPKPDPAPTGYRFLLFVTAGEPNSRQAVENLTRLCEAALPGRSEVQVLDVCEQLGAALAEGVVVTPTLVRTAPEPRVVVVGNLGNEDRVRAALGLPEEGGE